MRIELDLKKTPFSLDYTLQCGQTFRWQKQEAWWQGIVADKFIRMKQRGKILEFQGVDAESVESYFRLKDPLPAITSKISKDDHIRSAVQSFQGLRLIRQDSWECLISFICASFNNIPRIKRIIHNLAQKFGDKREFRGVPFYTFPTPNRLANAGIGALRACNAGFRAKMVRETARMIDKEVIQIDRLKSLTFEEARKELLKMPGVGDKVADCVLLFSLDKLEAFPVDVWIRKSILTHYHAHFDPAFVCKVLEKKALNQSEYWRIGMFAREYFGEYAGYAQQYLYHFERMTCDKSEDYPLP